MHNNIMAAGSRDRPPMLATGRYAQWRSRAQYESKRSDSLILTGIGDEIRPTVGAYCSTLQDPYYQSSKSHKIYAPTSKASLPTRSHATTRYKGKEIAKPITPPSESASEEDSDPEQAQKDKDMQKNLALIAKYFKKLYKLTYSTTTSELPQNTKQECGYYTRETVGGPVVQQSGIQCFNCKEFGHYAKECRKPKRSQSGLASNTDEEIDEQEFGSTLQQYGKDPGVPNADSGTDAEPLNITIRY
ncbi:retrovirus-related pol polyprotein from transposon TNT 1-94 [Tanacetum coccineum]